MIWEVGGERREKRMSQKPGEVSHSRMNGQQHQYPIEMLSKIRSVNDGVTGHHHEVV